MGVVALGGLLTSTLWTLLVLPIVYTLIDGAERIVAKWLASLRRKPQREASGEHEIPTAT